MSGLLAKAANTITSATHDNKDPRYMYPSKFAAQGKQHCLLFDCIQVAQRTC